MEKTTKSLLEITEKSRDSNDGMVDLVIKNTSSPDSDTFEL